MQSKDRPEFLKVLTVIYTLYRVEFSEAIADFWWQTMQQYDIEALRAAFHRHTLNPDVGQFIPKPADIVREVGGTTQDRSLLAWASVMQAVRRYGTHESVEFDDPIIHRVLVDLGGWVWLGQQQEKELPFIEKRFRDAYRAWLHRGAIGEQIPHLAGLIELTNRGSGYHNHVPQPKKVSGAARSLLA